MRVQRFTVQVIFEKSLKIAKAFIIRLRKLQTRAQEFVTQYKLNFNYKLELINYPLLEQVLASLQQLKFHL